MKLEINYYNIMRQITGKNAETIDFDEPITVKQWLEWFIYKYKDGLSDIYNEINPEKLFGNTTLFVNKQVVLNIQDILSRDSDISFLLRVSGG